MVFVIVCVVLLALLDLHVLHLLLVNVEQAILVGLLHDRRFLINDLEELLLLPAQVLDLLEGCRDLIIGVELHLLEDDVHLVIDYVAILVDQISASVDPAPTLVDQVIAAGFSHNDEVAQVILVELAHDVLQVEVRLLLLRLFILGEGLFVHLLLEV